MLARGTQLLDRLRTLTQLDVRLGQVKPRLRFRTAEGGDVAPLGGCPPPGPSLAERLEQIRSRVQEAVVYPPEARSRGITGVTRIRFEIAEDGRAEKIRTVATSGSTLLDLAAEQGAADAGELPMVYGRVEVPIRFELLRRRR